MENNMENDKEYQVYSNLMDKVFDLASELIERDGLTDAEEEFLESLDAWCEVMDEEDAENDSEA